VEEPRIPVFGRVHGLVIAGVPARVLNAGPLPVIVGGQAVAQCPHVAECEREALPPGGVAGGGGVAHEGNTVLVGMRHIGIGAVEGRQGAVGFRVFEPLLRHPPLKAVAEEPRYLPFAVEARTAAPMGDGVSAGPAPALRKKKRHAVAGRIHEHGRGALRRRATFDEDAAYLQALRVPSLFEPTPLADIGRTAVSTGHQPRPDRLRPPVLNSNLGHPAGRHTRHSDTPAYRGAGFFGGAEHHLLHLGMVERQVGRCPRRRFHETPVRHELARHVCVPPRELMGAGASEQVIYAEVNRFGNAPGCHLLPPHPVPEPGLAL